MLNAILIVLEAAWKVNLNFFCLPSIAIGTFMLAEYLESRE
jgi:hypothetical protein